jgi:membrane protein
MKWPGTWSFVLRLLRAYSEDSLADTAAALSYYGILALFPFLLFIVALVGMVLDPAMLRGLVSQLRMVAPPEVTSIISSRLESLLRGPHASVLTVGAVAALWAVSGGISALLDALDRCYHIRETRPFWKKRLIALGSTLVAAVASLLIVLVMFAVPLVGKWVGGNAGALISLARFPVGGLILLAMWAYLYWALPNLRLRFQLLSPGSLFGVLVWLVASWGFAEYARHFGKYEAIYGALGGVIVLLVWMWLSAVVLLLGAEINKILTPPREREKQPAASGQPRDLQPA